MKCASAPAKRRRVVWLGMLAWTLMVPPAGVAAATAAFSPPGDRSTEAVESSAPRAPATAGHRTAAWPSWLTSSQHRHAATLLPAKPHPAVARIIVPEEGATAYGSGTLVDVRDQYGLVVTNWHVVRDNQGVVEVVFPNGFRSHARPLKVDSDWDLAALVIWRPQIEPVKMAAHAPRPGDLLTIHGYGKGQYRVATGRCTTYYAPRVDFPLEMVELDVQARQGDSGGPIFNEQGELAGVLFGAGRGTTVGAFGPRVETFLATLAPDIGGAQDEAAIAVADRPAPNVHPRAAAVARNGTVRATPVGFPMQNAQAGNRPTGSQGRTSPQAGPQASGVQYASTGQAITWHEVAQSQWFGFLETILALIGLLAVVLQLMRVVR